jgi:hypothetical protein
MAQLPLPNNDTSLANAVAVEGGIVYMMGSFGIGLLKRCVCIPFCIMVKSQVVMQDRMRKLF